MALGSLIEPFQWGAGGQRLTPDEIARKREIAAALAAKGNPAFGGQAGFLGVLGRGLEGAVAGYDFRQADKAQAANATANANHMQGLSAAAQSLFGSPQSSANTTPSLAVSPEVGSALTGAAPPAPSAQDPMALASALIGKGEVPDRASIQEYLKNGGVNLDPATTAWCAAFVNASLGQAGMEGTGSNMARSFLKYGQAVDAPQKGDIAVFSRGDPNGPYGHVGFFDSLNPDGTVRVLGGNQGNAVSLSNYPAASLLGYRRAPNSQAALESMAVGESMPMAPAASPASAPVQTAQAGGIDPRVLAALSDRYADEGTKSLAQALFGQQIQSKQAAQKRAFEVQDRNEQRGYDRSLALDERQYTAGREDKRYSVEDQRAAAQQDISRQGLTPTDVREYEYAKGQGYEGTFADYQQSMKKAGAASTNVMIGEGNEFYKTLDENNAKTFSALSSQGVEAQSKAVQIDQLESLLSGAPSGAAAVFKQAAGEYGIETEGLSDIQAAQALINQMVPTQRVPGSGTMSDADLALFKASLPRLINTPDGNKTIIQTMRGMTQYQQQMGEIADAVANRSMSPEDGRKALRELPNPLAGLRKSLPKPNDASPSPAEGVSRPASKAEFDALPSGAQFEAPDGSIRRKP